MNDFVSTLKIVPTDDLIDELCSRSESSIFSGIFHDGGGPDNKTIIWNYTGDEIMSLGLCADLSHRIIKDVEENAL